MKTKVMIGIYVIFFLLDIVVIHAQVIIPFAKGIGEKKEINVSEIADKIRYVALETTTDCLLTPDILDVTLSSDYIFVSDYKHLFQFTQEGKFIRQIGRAGQGPGEYTQSMMGVVYDEAAKEIYISDSRQQKLLVYSFEGKFLREIKLDGWEYIRLKKDGYFYGVYNDFLFDKEKRGKELVIFDASGKAVQTFRFRPKKGERYPGINFSVPMLYTYADAVYYKNPFETEIYRIEGKKRVPVYELELGRLEKLNHEDDGELFVDTEKRVGGYRPNSVAEQKIYFNHLFETEYGIGIRYSQANEICYALYNKEKCSLCRVYSSSDKENGFTDDLENGIPFLPAFSTNGQLINVIQPEILLNKADIVSAKGSLKAVLSKLVEDDNPVLQIVTLKK